MSARSRSSASLMAASATITGFLISGDLGLRLDNVDGSHGADFHSPFVIRQKAPGEIEGLLRRFERVELGSQVPVRILHIACGQHHRSSKLEIRRVPSPLAQSQAPTHRVDLEISDERLCDGKADVGIEQWIEVREEVARRCASAVPLERIAGTRQEVSV